MMTQMTRRIGCVIAGLTMTLGLTAASQAAVLLNFTDSDHLSGTDTGADISPGQQVGNIAGSTWNQINTGALVSSIVDDAGNPLTGVTVDVGAALTGATVLDYDETPNFSNLGGAFDTGVFAGNAQSGMFNGAKDDSKVGVRISGLAAGVYTVYVTGLNTNADVVNNYDVYAGAVSSISGDTDYTGFSSELLNFYGDNPKVTTHWEEHVNYVTLSVTLAANEDLVIVTDGLNDGQNRGFLNTVEIVPEPASLALLGAGGLMMMSRRRRATQSV